MCTSPARELRLALSTAPVIKGKAQTPLALVNSVSLGENAYRWHSLSYLFHSMNSPLAPWQEQLRAAAAEQERIHAEKRVEQITKTPPQPPRPVILGPSWQERLRASVADRDRQAVEARKPKPTPAPEPARSLLKSCGHGY